MRIASWNVNSIRVRQERLLEWLDRHQPDALGLQETKVTDDLFPHAALAERGYRAAVLGQKTYNGVAVLARGEPTDVVCGLDDGEEDGEARLLAATVQGVRVLTAYVPNGKSMDSDKYPYKLRWLDRLLAYLERRHTPDEPLALVGDFNIARDARDVHDEAAWEGGVLYNAEVRDRLERLIAWGLVDTFRAGTPEGGHFSWWDYRGLSFPKNEGMRIDFVFATRPLAARLERAWIDRDERKAAGRETKPSDHAPAVADFGAVP